MNTENIPKIVVGIVVAVLIVSALLIPTLADANMPSTTYTNTGAKVTVFDADDAKSTDLDFDYTVSTHTVSGLTSTQSNVTVMSDNFCIAMTQSSTFWFIAYKTASGTPNYAKAANNSVNTDVTKIDISFDATDKEIDIAFTGDDTLGSMSFDCTYFAVTDDSGKWMYGDYASTNKSFYVNSVKDIYMLRYQGGNMQNLIDGVATANGQSATAIYTPTAVSGQIDAYTVSTATDGTGTIGVKSGDSNFTNGYVVVPASVIGHSQTESSIISMLNIIPLLVVIGIVIAACSMFLAKKN